MIGGLRIDERWVSIRLRVQRGCCHRPMPHTPRSGRFHGMRDRPLVVLAMVGVFLGTSLFVLASAEVGYRLARSRRSGQAEKQEPVGKMAEATLALFAFLLA